MGVSVYRRAAGMDNNRVSPGLMTSPASFRGNLLKTAIPLALPAGFGAGLPGIFFNELNDITRYVFAGGRFNALQARR